MWWLVKQKQTFPELWTCSGCPLARNYIPCFLHLANCYPSYKTQLKCCLLCEALSSLRSSWFLSLAPRFREYFAFPSFKVNLGFWAQLLSWEGSKPYSSSTHRKNLVLTRCSLPVWWMNYADKNAFSVADGIVVHLIISE